MAYRLWVLTIPKRLRVFFRHHGGLFKELSRIFSNPLCDWMQAILGRDDIRPAEPAAIAVLAGALARDPGMLQPGAWAVIASIPLGVFTAGRLQRTLWAAVTRLA